MKSSITSHALDEQACPTMRPHRLSTQSGGSLSTDVFASFSRVGVSSVNCVQGQA
tara:strand:- start:202 stop:366 length:165 start_codon:yes stop_codon:yes gene_type:complete